MHVHDALVQIDRQGGLRMKRALLVAYLVGRVVAQQADEDLERPHLDVLRQFFLIRQILLLSR